MTEVTIYHNPRCSKSRETLALIEAKGLKPRVVEYLKTPPSADTLSTILTYLNKPATELLRSKEQEFKDLNLKNFSGSERELIELMVTHPKLIERPIVVVGNQARIGRPPEAVLEII